MELNDPALVAEQYADERALAARRRVWNDFRDGPSSDDDAVAAVVEAEPDHVLEVGCGWGELSERIGRETGADVSAFDLSPRMASLARARGVRAFVADVQALPFGDRRFDVVVANAMLYHVPDLDLGLSEVARVLTDEGRLVATTFGENHLKEVWDLVDGPGAGLGFRSDNGEEILGRRFAKVERRTGSAKVTFPNAGEVRTYIASSITRSRYAGHAPDFEGPFVAHSDFAVFVAAGPIR